MAIALSGFVTFIILFLYRLIQSLLLKKRIGYFVDKLNSNWYDKETCLFKYINLIPLAGNVVFNLVQLIFVMYAFSFAVKGGINQAIVLVFNSFASFFNSIFFFIIFRERISLMQGIGMFLMTTCVGVLGYNIALKK